MLTVLSDVEFSSSFKEVWWCSGLCAKLLIRRFGDGGGGGSVVPSLVSALCPVCSLFMQLNTTVFLHPGDPNKLLG